MKQYKDALRHILDNGIVKENSSAGRAATLGS